MKEIIKNMSYFQGEIVYNIKQHKEKLLRIDYDLYKALKKLNFSTYLKSSGGKKEKGYSLVNIYFAIILLPFLKKRFSSLWQHFIFIKYINAKKDTYYRALRHEGIRWREFIYRISIKAIKQVEPVPLREKVLIADDTINHKRGKKIELASYIRDHTIGRTVLGMNHLVLSYFDGKSLFPLDFSIHSSSKRPEGSFHKAMDRRTSAYKRRKEAFCKKTDILIEMVKRAWNYGVEAGFVLFDSWFACPKVIKAIYQTGYNVICQLKRNNFRYLYQGKEYTLKKLYKHIAKDRMEYIPYLDLQASSLSVEIPDFQTVTLVFSKSKKANKWIVFLSTDTSLSSKEIIEIYAKRWGIELFFKDCKQLLYFGKEQNQDFDGIIAHHSLVFIRYIFIAYILRIKGIYSVKGTLFEKIADQMVERTYSYRIMNYFKVILCLSIEILSLKISKVKVSQLLNLIDNLMNTKLEIPLNISCET